MTNDGQNNNDRRKRALEKLLEKLKSGKNVQNRDLKTGLTADEYVEFERDLAQQREVREQLADKPEDIKEYERLLKRAQFIYNKCEGYGAGQRPSPRKTKMIEKLAADAESAFEDVLEHLSDIISCDAGLRIWFDRDIDFTVDGNLQPDPAAVPRVVTSRSLERAGSGIAALKLKRIDVKTNAVERALQRLNVDPVAARDNATKLKSMLGNLKLKK
jgi:hypothetical protein